MSDWQMEDLVTGRLAVELLVVELLTVDCRYKELSLLLLSSDTPPG